MPVTLKVTTMCDNYTLDVQASDTIGNVKALIQEKEASFAAGTADPLVQVWQELWRGDVQLEDRRTLSDYNIRPGHEVALRLRTPPPLMAARGWCPNSWPLGRA